MVDLDEPAGPPGSTVRHLLAHTSGLPFEGEVPIARPESRRIYSNEAFRVLAERLRGRAEMPFAEYVREAVCTARARPRPDRRSGVGDERLARRRARAGRELLVPRLVAEETRDEMTSVQFPGLAGRPPGSRPLRPARLGSRRPAEHAAAVVDGDADVRAHVRPFRRMGTFLWVDPDARARMCSAHDSRVRRVGEGGVAALRGRGPGRARR